MCPSAAQRDAIREAQPLDCPAKPRGFGSLTDDSQREWQLQPGRSRQKHEEPLLLDEAAHREQPEPAAGAHAIEGNEAADVDAMRHEDRCHAALAQACRHVAIAGGDDRGVATPACEFCRLDLAHIPRVRGEAVRHSELGGGSRGNVRRRVREIAVHTRDVRAAQMRGHCLRLLSHGS